MMRERDSGQVASGQFPHTKMGQSLSCNFSLGWLVHISTFTKSLKWSLACPLVRPALHSGAWYVRGWCVVGWQVLLHLSWLFISRWSEPCLVPAPKAPKVSYPLRRLRHGDVIACGSVKSPPAGLPADFG